MALVSGRARNIAGEKFGKLLAIESTTNRVRGNVVWKFKCDCGNEILRPSGDIIRGVMKSCGCLRIASKKNFMRSNAAIFNKSRAKHNKSNSPTYSTWIAMRKRCEKVNSKDYKNYGGRGITVCEHWKSFENFLADMGERPKGMTLDRIKTNGNYEPDNCRWATSYTQGNNRRVNRRITYNGITKNLKEWAVELGLSHSALAYRLNNGWSIESALTTPTDYSNGWKNGARK